MKKLIIEKISEEDGWSITCYEGTGAANYPIKDKFELVFRVMALLFRLFETEEKKSAGFKS